jgi:hypothetical protein
LVHVEYITQKELSMSWYLVILVVTTDILPGNIAYPSPSTQLQSPGYASEVACQADGPAKVAAFAARTLGPLPTGKKYAFACVQIP